MASIEVFGKAGLAALVATYFLLPPSSIFNVILYPLIGLNVFSVTVSSLFGLLLFVIIPFAIALIFDYLQLHKIKLARNICGIVAGDLLMILFAILTAGVVNYSKFLSAVGGNTGAILVTFFILFVGFSVGFWIGESLIERKLQK